MLKGALFVIGVLLLAFSAEPLYDAADEAGTARRQTSDPEVLSLADGTMGGGQTPSQEQFS